MGWNRRLLPLLLFMLLPLGACGGGEDAGGSAGVLSRLERGSVPTRPADFRGVVTLATENGIAVAVDPLAEPPSPEAEARLSPETEVMFLNGTVGEAGDLTLGQTVSIWFTEPAGDSLSMDGLAAAIVIEPMAPTPAP